MGIESMAITNYIQPSTILLWEILIFVFLLLVVIVGGAVALWYYLSFSMPVEIWEQHDNGIKVRYDKARRRQKNPTLAQYELFKTNRKGFRTFKLPPPPAGAVYLTGKGQEIIRLFRDSQGNFVYIPFKPTAIEFSTISADMAKWADMAHKETEQNFNKKSFWDQYGTFILTMMLICVFFIINLILIGEIAKVINISASASGSILEQSQQILNMISQNCTQGQILK